MLLSGRVLDACDAVKKSKKGQDLNQGPLMYLSSALDPAAVVPC